MLPSPSSSPQRTVLINRTNFNPIEKRPEKQQQTLSFLPTPPKCRGIKRFARSDDTEDRKRQKLECLDDDSESESASGSDAPSRPTLPVTRRRPEIYSSQRRRHVHPSTRLILESFVSSAKLDVYTCESADLLMPPIYASSYSNASKRGESSNLAVANEQGFVHVINTKRRDPWDPEPPRTTFQPHHNGIFDVKWNLDDTLLATASADQSTRITSVATGVTLSTLRAHTSTVKCIEWDPTNLNLLATGGRDGTIHLWDLRTDPTNWAPVASITGAHEEVGSRKRQPVLKSVTSLAYSDEAPHNLISSGTGDGKLRCWDIRLLQRRKSAPKPKPIVMTFNDPTCLHGSRRPRGIKSLCKGSGPTAGILFGFSADSRVHAYSLQSLTGYDSNYTHPSMQVNSFYVGLSASPCGRWLACGGPDGNSFLFDVHDAGNHGVNPSRGVQLGVHQKTKGEIGSVSWNSEGLATSSDEGVVRVWRPDIDVYRRCQADPETEQWHWDWSNQ